MPSFEAIVATYGDVSTSGDILTEQAALDVYNKLHEQMQSGYITQDEWILTDVRIEGNRERGKVYAIFTKEQDERERLAQVFGAGNGKSLSEMIIEDRGEL